MKKEYVSPEVEIDSFTVADTVLTESANPELPPTTPEIPDTEIDF